MYIIRWEQRGGHKADAKVSRYMGNKDRYLGTKVSRCQGT